MSTVAELKAEGFDHALRSITEMGELTAPDTVGDVVSAVVLIRWATAAGYVVQVDAARGPDGAEEWQVRFTRGENSIVRSEPTLAKAVCAAHTAAALLAMAP